MTENQALLMRRLDTVGVIVRQKHQLDLVGEVLLGEEDDAPEWWRDLADRFEEVDHAAADRLRQIAALIEEAQLA